MADSGKDPGASGAERRARLSALGGEIAGLSADPAALLELVARRMSEASGNLCVIRLLSADGKHLEGAAAVHHPNPETLAIAKAAVAAPHRVDEGIIGRVAETGVAELIPAFDPALLLHGVDPAQRALIERQGTTTALVAPLFAQGRTLGVLAVAGSDPTSPFDDVDLRLVRNLAAFVAMTIANARSAAAERAAHLALRESEEAHRLLFEASPIPLFVTDVDSFSLLAVNQAALALYGYSRDEFMQLSPFVLTSQTEATVRARIAAMGDAEASGLSRHRRRDGSELVAEYTTRALSFGGRRARISVVRDVTERFEAEQARALLAAIVESSNDAIVSKRLDGTVTSWNAAAERLFGYTAGEAIGKSIRMLIPPDRADEEARLIAHMSAGLRVEHFETVRLRKDGSEVFVSISLSPIRDASGNVVGASKTARDLTVQRKAAETLRQTEEQLRHSQKMDAIGRLAGGIAHDFNNVLSVILSYSELLLTDVDTSDSAKADLDEIRTAALRASELTRQLLLFSRQQVVERKVLDLNELLSGMHNMLKRILGEDIQLAAVPSARLGRIRADRGSVEQVIMNLVVNARDAMPDGGKLTIETGDVELDSEYARVHFGVTPGPHVMLAVSDTGIGMDAATQARIFEPFFTTKGMGKGTGLGLSTALGIAQQANGSISVHSELGKGTTFKVYFPRVESMPDAPSAAPSPATLHGFETILLVEDQEQVRAVAAGILTRNGYRALVAESPEEALRLSSAQSEIIHLLVTDVVMPQMSGAELAQRLASARPEMKTMYMSGYTDDSVLRHGVLESGVPFLQKPFTPESLTRKVREALDEGTHA